MKPSQTFLERINLPRVICMHLVGAKHTGLHRKIVGIIIMTCGVGVVHVFSLFHIEIVQFMGETVGAAIHGTGLIPFLQSLDKLTDEG